MYCKYIPYYRNKCCSTGFKRSQPWDGLRGELISRLYSHLENKHISCWTPCFMRTIISSNKKADFFLENNADFSLHNWRHFSIIEKKNIKTMDDCKTWKLTMWWGSKVDICVYVDILTWFHFLYSVGWGSRQLKSKFFPLNTGCIDEHWGGSCYISWL